MFRFSTLGSAVLATGVTATTPATNPFAGQTFYVNPANQAEYDESIATATGKTKDNLKLMKDTPISVLDRCQGKSPGNWD
jgi:cellulase/cellobiase CelA1